MISFRKTLVLMGLFIGLTGCSTPYQPHTFMGGYDDIQLSKNSYYVFSYCNGLSSPQTALEHVMRRSAELCLSHDYKFFFFEEEADESMYIRFSDKDMHFNSYSIKRPGLKVKVRFSNKEKDDCFDAQIVLQNFINTVVR